MLTNFESSLSIFLDGTLNWLTQNLAHFNLADHKELIVEDTPYVTFTPQQKSFAELVIACFLMNRHSFMRKRQEFKVLLEHIEQEIERSNFTYGMFRRIRLFYLYLIVYSCLKTCGMEVDNMRVPLQKLLNEHFVDAEEYTPWHQIEMNYYAELGEFNHRFPTPDNAYRYTSAFLHPSPIHAVRKHGYDLTHALFYLSDFGRQGLDSFLKHRYRNTCEYTLLLLGLHTRKRGWDLVGELLMCCNFLRCSDSPLVNLAWQGLFQAQNPQGSVSDRPPEKHKEAEESSENAGEVNDFTLDYHPTLVALLSSMSYLSRENVS